MTRGGPAARSIPRRGQNRRMSSGLLAKMSYDAAVRTLDFQERDVEQLRARTGTLLAQEVRRRLALLARGILTGQPSKKSPAKPWAPRRDTGRSRLPHQVASLECIARRGSPRGERHDAPQVPT